LNHVRITMGQARYATGGFTVPTVPYDEGFDNNDPVSTPDATYSNVSVLLPFDGTDDATTTTDASSHAATVTMAGGAKIDNGQSKFGGTSAYFDGTDDYVTLPNNSLYSVATLTDDFCIEAWIYPTSVSGTKTISSKRDNSVPDEHWLRIESGVLVFTTHNSTTADLVNMRGARAPILANEWTHVAVSREGGVCRMFVNGEQVGQVTQTANGTTTTTALHIGRNGDNPTAGYFYYQGWIDDFRFTKGEPVYTSAFDVPAGAHATS
jgi:hypothetical protein